MSGGAMSNTQLLEKMALLSWLSSQSDSDREILAAMTGVQVARELLSRLTAQPQVDAYKSQCISSIADFIQRNPGASQTQLNAVVEQQVALFAARVRALENTGVQ